MNFAGSIGTGCVGTGRSPRRRSEGKKTGRNPTDRGKQGVKRSVLTEGPGVPLSVVVAGANRHEMKLTRVTVQDRVIKRPEPTAKQPQGVCLDKGYDDDAVRDRRREFGVTAHIRTRGEDANDLREDAPKKARR